MLYNNGYMENRKLTQAHLAGGLAHERFSHLQHLAGLSEQSRTRVNEAMQAAVAHVERKRDLQYGMQDKHVGMALSFLDKHYEGRHDLQPKEREIIEKSFKEHFDIKDTPRSEPSNEQESA